MCGYRASRAPEEPGEARTGTEPKVGLILSRLPQNYRPRHWESSYRCYNQGFSSLGITFGGQYDCFLFSLNHASDCCLLDGSRERLTERAVHTAVQCPFHSIAMKTGAAKEYSPELHTEQSQPPCANT